MHVLHTSGVGHFSRLPNGGIFHARSLETIPRVENIESKGGNSDHAKYLVSSIHIMAVTTETWTRQGGNTYTDSRIIKSVSLRMMGLPEKM